MSARLIETEVFAELPSRLRKGGTPPERLTAGKATPMGSFLEGPSFDRHGNLYVVDLAWGRVFRIDEKGVFDVAVWYLVGILYFALIGRHRLVLSPEEECALTRGQHGRPETEGYGTSTP